MSVRVYKLPSTQDERLRLLADVRRDAQFVLTACGFRLRDAHVETWNAMDMARLRRCAERWRASAEIWRAAGRLDL